MRNRFRGLAALLSLAMLLVVGLHGTALAVGTDISAAVTRSYNAGPAVLPGMVVEAQPKDTTTVVPLNTRDISRMLGAVVPASDTTIVLTPQTTSTQQVLVSAAGHYSLLASNQNGDIKSGDYLTVSAVSGIVMKAGSDQTQAIGRAAGNFNGSGSLGTISLKGSTGSKTTVAIGHIPVDVQLMPNPLFQKNTNGLSGFIAKTASTLANRPVSPSRAYLSTAIAFVTLAITGIIFYAGTRSGIIAIGRNPLAQAAVTRSLMRTIAVGLLIFAAGVLVAYVILRG